MAIVWRVEDEAERVLRKRVAFRKCLASFAEPPAGIDAAELIFGELVANTVRHANAGEVEVCLELDDHAPPVLVVRDRGPGLRARPALQDDNPYAESGRGLGIVELLAREVAVDRAAGGGTVVRATLPVLVREGEDSG